MLVSRYPPSSPSLSSLDNIVSQAKHIISIVSHHSNFAMNRDELEENVSSPPTTELRKQLSIDTSVESDGESEIEHHHRDKKQMANKKMSSKSSKKPISPLQSFMGDLMSSKKITSIVEDNARIAASLKQSFAISKAETRKGTERWDSASAFSADVSPTPTLTSSLSSSVSAAALKSPPSLPISPPTRATPTVDALVFPTSPLETPETSPHPTTDRSRRSRSPSHSSSAPRIPKRRHSTDMSLSPIR